MKRQCTFVLALALATIGGAINQQAFAQRVPAGGYPNYGRVYQAANPVPAAAARGYQGAANAQSEGPFRDDPIEPLPGPEAQSPIFDGYSPEGYCDTGCNTGCCGGGCSSGSCCMSGGRFFVQADYIYARSSFSEATAYVDVDDNGNTTDSTYVPLDFNHDSSFRVGGGYRLNCCGDEIRFMYTQLGSYASDQASFGDVVPYEASPPPGGVTDITSDINLDTYDLEFRKRIPLGGECCGCGCGDACGDACGCCQRCCPTWDLAWSGGLRFAEANWNRNYAALNADNFIVTNGRAEMDFDGAGVRTGIEGRRYFFNDGRLSVYMKGDLSLLYGDLDITSSRATNDPNSSVNPATLDRQTFSTRQLIPITEIEAGVTTNFSRNCAISAGYLLTAWHDLGFRDEPQLTTLFDPPTSYDDGNIMGFDGFFARFEFSY